MKTAIINGVEWSYDELKKWLCNEFAFYYGGRISKTAVKIHFLYHTRDGLIAIKFSVKTPKSIEYGGYRTIYYTCVFETGIFTRDDC